ncbi:MAG: RNB domain-containing ribonuclease [Rhodocyclaceae bacterium]|nr:RNB domain-containing ribonuclease [Rhodocyclaceae bacterium]
MMSYLLFEEDGAFRAGAVLADNHTSLQVELPGGRRVKVKTAQVLLQFAAPSAETLLAEAHQLSESIDTAFLWEVSPDAEFGFDALATDYAGHPPTPVEATAILLRLHSAPIWFHRKGRGRFRRAPPDILQAALAGQEKKRLQQQAVEHMTEQLVAGTLPHELSGMLPQLLYKPDRNRLETKAFESACAETGLSAPHLLEKCGALPSTHDYHLGRFLFEFFPNGLVFPVMPETCSDVGDVGDVGDIGDLPLAEVRAFSIDDAQTTEIDDAFSVTPLPDGGMRIGIHIAAPGLGFSPESVQGRMARERLSTVYMPGRKITMLPDEVVEQFTLSEGKQAPALSLYLTVASDLRVLSTDTCLERVPIVANLRHHDIEPLFNEETLTDGLSEFPFHDELKKLWELATVLEAGRGKSTSAGNRKDYNFLVDWTIATEQGAGHVAITERPRGSPLDKLVAELMIVANSTWGALLRDKNIAALYRAQAGGKVRMTTVAASHEGLGVDCYAWSSSPLRRYVDLVNQWQLIAYLREETPPFTANSPELLSALRDFELTYATYAEFQQAMERYWCLRFLLQESQEAGHLLTATVLRDNLVRCESLPLVLKINGTPVLDRDARVRLSVDRIDLMEADIKAHFVECIVTTQVGVNLPPLQGEGWGGDGVLRGILPPISLPPPP